MTWALPLSGALGDDVAHAPTATAEALALPARLIATLPLEPDRRRVRLGPVPTPCSTGPPRAYVDLVRSVVPDERLALVPRPTSPFPARRPLRARIVAALRTAAWLPAASPPTEPGAAGSDEGARLRLGWTGCPGAAGWEQGGAPAAARLREDAPRGRDGSRARRLGGVAPVPSASSVLAGPSGSTSPASAPACPACSPPQASTTSPPRPTSRSR